MFHFFFWYELFKSEACFTFTADHNAGWISTFLGLDGHMRPVATLLDSIAVGDGLSGLSSDPESPKTDGCLL